MASEKIYIIDESTDGEISPDYDLLLDTSINMEDYIEIKEKNYRVTNQALTISKVP